MCDECELDPVGRCYGHPVGDVLNLNHARKRKKRKDARAQADANAIKHGRTKAERDAERAQRALDDARLDGARRETSHGDEDADES